MNPVSSIDKQPDAYESYGVPGSSSNSSSKPPPATKCGVYHSEGTNSAGSIDDNSASLATPIAVAVAVENGAEAPTPINIMAEQTSAPVGTDNTDREYEVARRNNNSIISDLTTEIELPLRYFDVGCCACTCAYCEFWDCCGLKSHGTCCCLETECMLCKTVTDDKACCIMCLGSTELVEPTARDACNCYQQICCIEAILAPCAAAQTAFGRIPMAHAFIPNKSDGITASGDIVACLAAFCGVLGINPIFPSCLGCFCKGNILCCDCFTVMGKPLCGERRSKQQLLCMICKTNARCVEPWAVVKVMAQMCCLDARIAVPCTDREVPCLCTPLPFFSCCIRGACCRSECCATYNQLAGFECNDTTDSSSRSRNESGLSGGGANSVRS